MAFLSLSIVGLMFMPLSSAQPSQWTYVAIDTALNRIYIDLESIEVDRPVVTYSVKSAESKTGAYRVDRLSMNCRDGKSLRKGSATYDRNDRMTEPERPEQKGPEWEPIAPDTVMDFFRKMLCLNGEPRKNVRDHLRGWGEFLKKQIDREEGDR